MDVDRLSKCLKSRDGGGEAGWKAENKMDRYGCKRCGERGNGIAQDRVEQRQTMSASCKIGGKISQVSHSSPLVFIIFLNFWSLLILKMII